MEKDHLYRNDGTPNLIIGKGPGTKLLLKGYYGQC
jgi:hypothetical protein